MSTQPGQALTPVQYADNQRVDEVRQLEALSPLLELGTSGLKRTSGYLDEEFLPHLRGRKAVQVYREMGDNDPIAGAMLFAITNLLRKVDYQVTPGGKTRADAMAAHFLETCIDDMSDPWDTTLNEILSFLQYGWAWTEVVYKRRGGPDQRDHRQRSKHTDGMIGWRKIALRAQETLHTWVFDAESSVVGMVQMAPPDYQLRTIPLDRSLLFRFNTRKNSPEGTSILRTSYRPWYYKKRLEEFEAIGVERDLAGLPIVKVPTEYLRAKPGTEQYKMVEAMKKMVRSVRRNEQEGVVFPVSYDPDTKQPMFSFELLASGGTRQNNTDVLIRRYEERQLMTVMADFLLVGHQQTGTYNLHVDKTAIFREALNATASSIAEVFNRYAIPKLFGLNGWRLEEYPSITPSNVENPDLTQLASFLSATAGLGYSWGPDADIERFLRKASGLPELDEQAVALRRREARIAESTRIATETAAMLAAKTSLNQAMMADAMGVDPSMLQQAQSNADAGGQQMAQATGQPQPAQQQQPQPQGGAR